MSRAREGDGNVVPVCCVQETHRFVVLQAEPVSSSWTRTCVRLADCVLLLAAGGDNAAVSPFERDLIWAEHSQASQFGNKELVLLWPDSTTLPQNTIRWLQVRHTARACDLWYSDVTLDAPPFHACERKPGGHALEKVVVVVVLLWWW